MDSRQWQCATCGEVREFVQPPCVDGHTEDGGECPEWACVECGEAFVLASAPVVTSPAQVRSAA